MKEWIKQSDEYRLQTMFALLQSGVILFGSLLTGVILKGMGYPDKFQEIAFSLWFVRNWGFLLILIPLAWAAGSIWMEKNQAWFTKRWSLVSGLSLFVGLIYFMTWIVGRAGSGLIHMSQ